MFATKKIEREDIPARARLQVLDVFSYWTIPSVVYCVTLDSEVNGQKVPAGIKTTVGFDDIEIVAHG